MKRNTILMGAVAFAPAAVTIWDGFKAWFNKNGLGMDSPFIDATLASTAGAANSKR